MRAIPMTENELNAVKTDVAVIKRDITQISQVYKKVDDTLEQITQLAKTIAVQEKILENDTRRIELLEEAIVKHNQDEVEFRKELNVKLETMTNVNTQDRDKRHKEILEAVKEMSDSVNSKFDAQDKRIGSLEKWKWYVAGALGIVAFLAEKFPWSTLFGG